MQYNPRYIAYCLDNGFIDPEQMMAHDDTAYPGGLMTGFILWIGEQWTGYYKVFGKPSVLDANVQRKFDSWLASRLLPKAADSGDVNIYLCLTSLLTNGS